MAALTPAQKRTDRFTALGLVVFTVLAVAIFAVCAFAFAHAFTGSIASAEDYELFELEATSYTATVDAAGTVVPEKTPVTTPDVTGTVEEVLVEEDDEVEAGDVLLVIDSPEVEAQLSSTYKEYQLVQADEDEVRVGYDAALAALEAAEDAKEQAQAVIDAQNAEAKAAAEAAAQAAAEAAAAAAAEAAAAGEEGADSSASTDASSYYDASAYTYTEAGLDSSYDEAIEAAQAEYDEWAAQLEEAEANTTVALSAYSSAEARAASLNVKASSDGIICDLDVTEGMNAADLYEKDYVMQIADDEALSVLCSVSEEEVSDVMRSQDASVLGIMTSGAAIAATVSEVGTEPNDDSDDETSYYDVTLELATLAGAEMDMEVDVSIAVQDYGTVFYVPSSSVMEEEGDCYVEIVYDDETTAQREVEVLAETDDDQKIVRSTALAGSIKIRADLS